MSRRRQHHSSGLRRSAGFPSNVVSMAMSFRPDDDVAAIRSRINHPVVDSDGHVIEYLPLVRDVLVELAGERVAKQFDLVVDSGRLTQLLSPEQRREVAMMRIPWWGIPTRNTLDRATAMLPQLLYRRLDQLGIDLTIVYPTYGLTAIHLTDEELRRATSRAFNTYLAEVYAPYADRILPVACIPTFTPDEAIAELEFAVRECGMRAVMMGGAIPRQYPGTDGAGARWIDGLGHASPYDYTPMWQKCVELGVSPTFHSTGAGWGARTSPTNYVFNHIGNFAAAGELTARSLFFGGVPMRFPGLRFAFLEGGAAWACNLLSDILGHWEKRNGEAIARYDPGALDRRQLEALFDEHSEGRIRDRRDRLGEGLNMLSEPIIGDDVVDEFAESQVKDADDIIEVFTTRYFFGCEADDPMTSLAFALSRTAAGARLPAIFASDIGHWDVPDFARVLCEAWESVDAGLLDESDFRALTFDHPVALWTGTNRAFFKGTVIEAHVP
jgi:predicted TIM-barrel fold metal-dependent hydrolase